MSRFRVLVPLVAMACVLAATVSVAVGQTGGEEPKASEVGVTPKEIRIGVVADVENAFAPGLFEGSVDGVRGWAKYTNAHGGLAGRKVVVDFYDSKLSATEARNGLIAACENDFAIVGTSALFVNNVDDLVGCRDAAGRATGLPDVPVVTTEVVHQCSPVTFAINPPNLVCSTKDETPQTWYSAASRIFYYLDKYGKDLHGLYLLGGDLRAAAITCEGSSLGYQKLGVEADETVAVSGRAPQAAYTPYVRSLRENKSNYVYNCAPFAALLALRREAEAQGVASQVKVWDCPQTCYDEKFISEGGKTVDGNYAGLFFLPFDETKSNKMLASFVKYTGKSKVTGFGANAWAAGIALRDAVNRAVEQGGVNVTRASVLEQLKRLNGFTADGMLAKTDLGRRIPSACYVLMQVQDGKFVRVDPKKKGTFACKADGLVKFKFDPSKG